MPSPPRKGETQKEFLGRCIPTFVKEGMKQDQASAACYDMWRKKHGGKKPSESKNLSDTELLQEFHLKWKVLNEEDEATKSDQDKMRELERK